MRYISPWQPPRPRDSCTGSGHRPPLQAGLAPVSPSPRPGRHHRGPPAAPPRQTATPHPRHPRRSHRRHRRRRLARSKTRLPASGAEASYA